MVLCRRKLVFSSIVFAVAPPPGAYDVRGSFVKPSFNKRGTTIPAAAREGLAPKEAAALPGPGTLFVVLNSYCVVLLGADVGA